MLRVSSSQSRIVERVDILIGPLVFGLVEGATLDMPITLGLKKQDFFEDIEALTLDEVEQLGTEILAYVARVRINRTAPEPLPIEPPA